MDKIKTVSTSKSSAEASDIILRETNKTRLIFRPLIVDNPHDRDASVKGTFIFQAKKPSGKWEDYNTLPLTKLRDGEWVKLDLKSEEVANLISSLENYRELFKKYGIRYGETEFVITSRNIKSFLNHIAKFENKDIFLEKLEKLNTDEIYNIGQAVNISRIRKALKIWHENRKNEDEEFWQKFFSINSWIISQAFSTPVILLKGKAYMGGKGIDNKGGSITDFIYKNSITKNLSIVEIKTPLKKILSSEYRGKGSGDKVYCINEELTGAINQLLNYKDKIQKEFYALSAQSTTKFNVFNPKCILLYGTMVYEKLNNGQLKTFELFRNSNKDIEIITYDELYNKINNLLKLFRE